jgi:transketolase
MNYHDTTTADYQASATKIRAHVLRMIHQAKSSHVGSALSIADLLAVLYGGILHVDPAHLQSLSRDRFILSKGHACAAVYAILAECGFFPKEWLDTFYLDGSHLPGHITHSVPGVEASTGALGHGLPIGCGMALAGKQSGQSYRVFVLLSDGECDEGSIWEAALFAPNHGLDNLVVIVDYNKIQALGKVKEVLDLEPLAGKWQAFGWATREIDGHDFSQIENTLQIVPFKPRQPSCIIAHTIKGKGVSFMENQLAFHYKPPDDEQLHQALTELGVSE